MTNQLYFSMLMQKSKRNQKNIDSIRDGISNDTNAAIFVEVYRNFSALWGVEQFTLSDGAGILPCIMGTLSGERTISFRVLKDENSDWTVNVCEYEGNGPKLVRQCNLTLSTDEMVAFFIEQNTEHFAFAELVEFVKTRTLRTAFAATDLALPTAVFNAVRERDLLVENVVDFLKMSDYKMIVSSYGPRFVKSGSAGAASISFQKSEDIIVVDATQFSEHSGNSLRSFNVMPDSIDDFLSTLADIVLENESFLNTNIVSRERTP